MTTPGLLVDAGKGMRRKGRDGTGRAKSAHTTREPPRRNSLELSLFHRFPSLGSPPRPRPSSTSSSIPILKFLYYGSMSSTILKPAGTVSYHEPSLPHLLTLISFIYLLNFARTIADTVLGAGLLGEIAIGVVYGPVAKILETEWQDTFLAIGYIGLVLIVFEGGLTLDLRSFVPLLPLALVSALAGILLPLAFTFALFSAPSFGYPPIQAFTAGSALASTSLGTTFFVLKSAGQGLDATRIAQVLKGAALVDDIIALVLLSVISSLAGDEGTSLGWTIGRPIVASVAMCLVSPLVILYVLRPFFKFRKVATWVDRGGKAIKLFLGVAVLSAYLAM